MTDNRNNSSCFNQAQDGRGTVCIDTYRVLDSCRDRDCFEDVRVYLSTAGEDILSSASTVRARSARILWAYVGVDEVPFNCGFYQITIRYYVEVELEACLGMGRNTTFNGIAVLNKDVILYGGEGSVTTFSSSPENNLCNPVLSTPATTAPIAVVESVEPIVLGTKITECGCPCPSCEIFELPDTICEYLGGCADPNTTGPRLYLSFGIFSVIRLKRSAQLLITATDYSVPDKECVPLTNDEDPCSVFRNLPFPTSQFKTNTIGKEHVDGTRQGRGGCGCQGKRD